MKVASTAHKDLRVLVASNADEGFEPFVHRIAAAEELTVSVTKAPLQGLGETLAGQEPFHVVILADGESYENLRLIAPFLSRGIAEGGVLYLGSFGDRLRFDASLTATAAIDMLAGVGFTVYAASYYAFFRRDVSGDQFTGAAQELDLVNQSRILFIVGHARSGTSVLFQIANDQPDIHLTYEANLFLTKNRHDIVGNYNSNQRRRGQKVGKGFYLPPVIGPLDNLTSLHRALLSNYAIVGDKIALGPRGSRWEPHPAATAFEWFQGQFPFALYLCVLRNPLEGIAAVDRMTPDQRPILLIENWAKTAKLVMDMVATMPKQRLILFEDLVERRYRPILSLLGRNVLVDRQDVTANRKTTGKQEVDNYFKQSGVEPLRHLAEDLDEWYRVLPSLFDSDTGELRMGVTHDQLDAHRKLLQQIDDEIQAHI